MKGNSTYTSPSADWLKLTLISLLLGGAVALPMLEETSWFQDRNPERQGQTVGVR
ncbi:hypothetical protein POG22_16135 [Geitlerinema sp. CS-897]|nr:hypothetical protein [Geitlerinema sp. CS-897]